MKKRPLGQNFLVDHGIAREIVHAAAVEPNRPVVEIGPGKGILTELLLEQTPSLTAIEIDPKLCSTLRQRFGARENFHLLEGDAAKFDYGSLGPRFQVVSNLPYYAATHILKRLIDYRSHIQDMTLMLQKEVVDRFTAQPGQKEYGSLTVFLQYYCDVERLLEIPNSAFSPPPKIDSSLVKLSPLPQPRVEVSDQKTFFKIIHAAFMHKRKMLKNNFKSWENNFRTESDKIHWAGIDLSRRGETLSLKDFATLANHVHERND
jgi:16S rRNA (adenine1518-N6/adenine1519-N6)-dimethyltransferase